MEILALLSVVIAFLVSYVYECITSITVECCRMSYLLFCMKSLQTPIRIAKLKICEIVGDFLIFLDRKISKMELILKMIRGRYF